jgi:hypothetical protein
VGFKALLAMEAKKSDRSVLELVAKLSVHSTMTHNWNTALLDGAVDIMELSNDIKPTISLYCNSE